jgi:hypothetical protein
VNIQVFYQKDFENLIFKYGLAERESPEHGASGADRQPETVAK